MTCQFQVVRLRRLSVTLQPLHVYVSPCLCVIVSVSPCLCVGLIHCCLLVFVSHVRASPCLCVTVSIMSPCLCVTVSIMSPCLCVTVSMCPRPCASPHSVSVLQPKPRLFQETPLKYIRLCLSTLSAPFFFFFFKLTHMINLTIYSLTL